MTKESINSLTKIELTNHLAALSEPAYRATQIYEWLHVKHVKNLDDMTNLSKQLRDKLKQNYQLTVLETVQILESAIDGTCKYLFRLPDGETPLNNNVIESVLMKYHHGNSVCISSQVGCRMGCKFCASTLGGLERNLEPAEMLEQIYRIQDRSGERVSNIVIMGTGEPLDNYETLIKFLHMISDADGLNISQRNITVSTCGLTDGIRRLAEEGLAITLALSLHAPNDELRKTIMPVACTHSLSEVIKAMDYFYDKTGRRVSYEYSLIQGVNDSSELAEELSKLLRHKNCHVNLIPINPIKERDYSSSVPAHIQNFKNILEKYRINVTIRREMGSDINAACGQLRKSYAEK